MVDKIPMTAGGYQALQDELKHLKSVERPEIIKAIAEAREHGDLSENAEYHAARERQSFIEGRVMEIEDKISRAEVIDPAKMKGEESIKFGASILLFDEDTEEEIRYRIVGEDESDIKSGLLSITAPLARGLIGKAMGDVVEVSVPAGSKSYEVVEVNYE